MSILISESLKGVVDLKQFGSNEEDAENADYNQEGSGLFCSLDVEGRNFVCEIDEYERDHDKICMIFFASKALVRSLVTAESVIVEQFGDKRSDLFTECVFVLKSFKSVGGDAYLCSIVSTLCGEGKI